MSRKLLIRSATHPYHITTRSNNKEWFYIDIEKVWNYSQNILLVGEIKFNVKVEAFVLMSNHYHMLIHTPDANIDRFMRYFNQELGRSIARDAGRINRIFGAGYKWNLILSNAYYFNVIRYIYQNPVRAQIVKRVEDYRYCDVKQKHIELIDWLNTPISVYEAERTKMKLKRKIIDTCN